MKINTQLLFEMLTYARPHGSRSERQFIARYIDSVKGVRKDAHGNRYIAIGDNPETMISCHTDTVHSDGGRQKIEISKTGIVSLRAESSKRNTHKWDKRVLGSDDAAGVYAALRMIDAGVPALYVFHRAEEIGGNGSAWIADFNPTFLRGIKRCIALDRRGYYDVITHQMCGRCCSDEFALALGDALNMKHEPCQFGSFTDSANYTRIIPECTNVSVGYFLEHTEKESLDTTYLEELINALIRVDFDSLPTVRETWEFEDLRQKRAKTAVKPWGDVFFPVRKAGKPVTSPLATLKAYIKAKHKYQNTDLELTDSEVEMLSDSDGYSEYSDVIDVDAVIACYSCGRYQGHSLWCKSAIPADLQSRYEHLMESED